MRKTLIILVLLVAACSSSKEREESVWEADKTGNVLIRECEEWKERDPEADC